MSIVVDSSVSLSWVFTDEATDATETLLDRVRDEGGIVPALWEYEVCNALLSAVRRDRLDQATAARIITLLHNINLRVIQAPLDMRRVFVLANAHGLSAYDAAYLDLAMNQGVPLATLDQKLIDAAGAIGVEILPRLEPEPAGPAVQ